MGGLEINRKVVMFKPFTGRGANGRHEHAPARVSERLRNLISFRQLHDMVDLSGIRNQNGIKVAVHHLGDGALEGAIRRMPSHKKTASSEAPKQK